MGQTHTLSKHNTTKVNNSEEFSVVFHSTQIFKHDKVRDLVTLSPDDFVTATTQARYSQIANEFGYNCRLRRSQGWFYYTGADGIEYRFSSKLVISGSTVLTIDNQDAQTYRDDVKAEAQAKLNRKLAKRSTKGLIKEAIRQLA
jgi:hypothetical protein